MILGCNMTPMPQYSFLTLPSFNRVYTKAASRLALAELDIVRKYTLQREDWNATLALVGGNEHVCFECDELDEAEVAFLSNLSSIYALYEHTQNGALRPVELRRADCFDDSLLTIQRYSGKTNEQFTKLLVNVAVACSAHPERMLDGNLKLLDPLCGRGTTLNQALMYGLGASGIELDRRDFESYSTFIRRWVKDQRLKHSAQASKVRLDMAIGKDRDSYKAGRRLSLSVVNDDTLNAGSHYGRRSFDVVVADLPYGVQHGNTSRGELQRSPASLLEAALPVWSQLMKKHAVLAISWNTLVLKRDECARLMQNAGLTPLRSAAFDAFEHPVAQAITRDLLVARKNG
jgi:hypothetical protein